MKVLQPLRSLTRSRRIRMPVDDVKRIIQKNGAQQWFTYIFEKRHRRWDVWKSGFWIDDHLSRDARILETGCGCGMNLIWLGQRGFTELYGYDCDPTAVAAGKDLGREAGLNLTLWQDDGLSPQHMPPEKFDAIIALNWISLVEEFSLPDFLNHCSKHLMMEGVVVLDAIDIEYNNVPNNEYLTSDWQKPIDQRSPSEYKKRYSREQIAALAGNYGLQIEKRMTAKETIPKSVYVLRKSR